jgi:hypothetical protein
VLPTRGMITATYLMSDNPWALGRLYVDGTDETDLPDFHSVDASLWIPPFAIPPVPGTGL